MKKILPLIFVGLLASILIFYKFPNLPKYLAFDEVEFAKLALSLDNKPYIAYSTLATGHSTLYFYIILLSFNIFGVTNFALRLPAAIFGILSAIMFYLVIQMSFRAERSENFARDDLMPFLLTIIFLTSRWFLNFARFSFEATFLLFLELTSIYFLLRSSVIPSPASGGIEGSLNKDSSTRSLHSLGRNDIWNLIFSGSFAGLAFLSYTPGRIFFILPLSFIIFTSLRGSAGWRRRSNLNFRDCFATARNDIIRPLIYFLIPFVIVTTPLISYLLTNKDSRIDQQFFLKNHEMPIQEKLTGLWHNVSSTALMFNIKGDVNGRHNYPLKPALNPILGILFMAGMIISIRNFKNIFNKLFLLYFFISLFPALLTYPWENPNMLRTYTVLPSIVYFIGQGLSVIARSETTKQSLKLLRLPRSLWSLAMTVVIIFFILLSSLYELRTYFKYQSTVFNQSFEIKLPLEKAIKAKGSSVNK